VSACVNEEKRRAYPDFQKAMLPVLRLAPTGATTPSSRRPSVARVQADEQEATNCFRADGSGGYTTVSVGEDLPSEGWARRVPRPREVLHYDRGIELLKTKPAMIDMKLLEQFPEYIAFRDAQPKAREMGHRAISAGAQETPEELLEESYQELDAGCPKNCWRRSRM